MRKSRFTEAQIIGMIKEQEAGIATADVCRGHGLSPASFYKLKANYGGMELSNVCGRASNIRRSTCGLMPACLRPGPGSAGI
jgi:hypothetical protein